MESIFKKINFSVFLISFAIGILVIYIGKPNKKVIIKYPTPQKVYDYQYQDDAKNCYTYTAKKVECTGKEKKIPIQE